MTLRIAYLSTIAAFMLVAWTISTGELFAMMNFPPDALPAGFFETMKYGQLAMTALVGAVFLFLAFKPFWWGKLICWSAALCWIGSALIAMLFFEAHTTPYKILIAGLIMIAAGITHQIVDPRFGGPPLTSQPRSSS